MLRGFDCASGTLPYIQHLKADGYEFGCRYYRRDVVTSWAISPEEARALSEAGIYIVSVFQHTSNKPSYFTRQNAAIDAVAALDKARQMEQPKTTAIYFAVDTNPGPDDHNPVTPDVSDVVTYFQIIRDIMMYSGYTIGVYGSGLVCQEIRNSSIAQHAWLTNARGWYGTRTFDDWAIRQSLPTTLPYGLEIDPDEGKGVVEAGMWRY